MNLFSFYPQQRTYLRYLILLTTLIFLTHHTATAEMVDRVVAVVNDDIITLSEVEAETADIYKALANSSDNLLETMEEAREIALDKIINRTLLEQKAKEFDLSVSDDEINTAYERTRSRMSLSPEEFKQKMQESGITEKQYREKLRESILQSKIVSVDVRSKIVITDEMILEYYDKHYTSNVGEGDYYLLQIGFNWDEDTAGKGGKTKEDSLKLAQRIRKLAVDGQDFSTLAQKFSDLPSAVDGGDLGAFALDEMAEAMQSAVKDLKTGEISKIVEINNGYQFFKLLSGEEDAIVVTSSYENKKEEIREKLYEEKMDAAYEEWVKKLKNNAYIQKL